MVNWRNGCSAGDGKSTLFAADFSDRLSRYKLRSGKTIPTNIGGLIRTERAPSPEWQKRGFQNMTARPRRHLLRRCACCLPRTAGETILVLAEKTVGASRTRKRKTER